MAKQDFELSKHARNMLLERGIKEEWLWETLEKPEQIEDHPDGKSHYIKSIAEYGSRYLRIIVNRHNKPKRVVTLYFDRKLRSAK